MSEKGTIDPARTARLGGDADRGAGPVPQGESRRTDPSACPHLGLVVPGPRGPDTANGLAGWLLATATRADLTLDVADLGARPVEDPAESAGRDRDGYVLLVGQYGAAPAPAVEDVVTRHAARWDGRPVGLVAYGGVSRGRDAVTTLRATLADLGATVAVTGLGVNVAQLRGRGPSAFERVGWEMVLDEVAACARPPAIP